jgi:Plasmid pRiA4b ORF-3-like protein
MLTKCRRSCAAYHPVPPPNGCCVRASQTAGPAAYRIHVWIRRINPMIWRRLVVPSGNTLADLHYAIQIAFAWTDYHLHRFRIRGKEYGIPRRSGPWYSRDARDLRLIDFHFRVNERFLYEYDFTDGWEHQVRIEQFVPPEQTRPYSVCVGGRPCGTARGLRRSRRFSAATRRDTMASTRAAQSHCRVCG